MQTLHVDALALIEAKTKEYAPPQIVPVRNSERDKNVDRGLTTKSLWSNGSVVLAFFLLDSKCVRIPYCRMHECFKVQSVTA